jgi:putative DNA primase/helicase
LESGGNYGVVCGKGIIEIDLDEPKTQKRFEDNVDTFTVKSGGSIGKHYYCMSNVTENGAILGPPENNKRENWGNIQAKNKYVVGPGCNHYTGGTYEIIKDAPFAWISKEELEAIFGEHLVWTGEKWKKDIEEQAQKEQELIDHEIPIKEIIANFEDLRQISASEFQGAHPMHGSTTGQNFCVNTEKNCWHCFRCNSGGGPLSWLAVKHGLIRCDQAQKGALKGELFQKTLNLAREEGYEIGSKEEEQISPDVAKYFEGKPPQFVPAYLAEEIMQKFRYLTREQDEIIFLYHPDKGTYTPNGEAHIKRQTKKALGKYLKKYRQNEVINYVVCSTLKQVEESPPHFIPLKNGILDLKTKQLKPFNPEYFILNATPIIYNPQAKCPKTFKFISEIVNEADVPVLQEMSGYCLWRKYPIHKALMLVGDGANGKSTFLQLLRTMLGEENVCTISLHDLETSSFARSSLYGKLANIYPDLSDRALRSTGYFKMLTGGDTVSAEYKFHDRFEFQNYAKLIFSCNKVPESPDDTTAFFRRWNIINFPNQFQEGDPKTDPNILEKLTTEEELSGFFNWALEGLERLLKNGRFSTGKTVEETREQYIRASDPVKAFAMDCVESQQGNIITKDVVYKAFLKYCEQMKLPSCASNVFSMKLPQHIPEIQGASKKVGNKLAPCWRNISIINNWLGSSSSSTVFLTSAEQVKNNNIHSKRVARPTEETEKPNHNIESYEKLEEFTHASHGNLLSFFCDR